MADKDEKEQVAGEVELKAGLFSIRLPADLEREATPQSIAELKASVFRDLLSIAAAPTKLLSQLVQGLVRVIQVATFGGKRKKSDQRLSRLEALANLQTVLEKNNAAIVEFDGRPVIVMGELLREAQTPSKPLTFKLAPVPSPEDSDSTSSPTTTDD